MSYRVISTTNPYQAKRHGRKCEVAHATGQTLSQAIKIFLGHLNADKEKCFNRIGQAVAHGYAWANSRDSYGNKLYAYECDYLTYTIEEDFAPYEERELR